MYRPPIPGSVTAGRVLLITEGALWLLLGLLVVVVGIVVITVGNSFTINGQVTSLNGVTSGVGIAVTAFGAVLVGLAIASIWSGAAMGRLTGGPRVTGLVLASLGLIVGLLSTVGGSQTYVDTSNGTTFQSSPIPGLILIVLNVAIIWTLGLAASARAAFGGVRAGAGYPMAPPPGYGPPPGYPPPGYGPAPGYPTPPSAPPPWPPSPYYAPPPPPDPGQGYPTPPPLGAPTGPAYQPPGSPPLSPPPDPPSSSPPSPAGP
jgi:hypothetical protein